MRDSGDEVHTLGASGAGNQRENPLGHCIHHLTLDRGITTRREITALEKLNMDAAVGMALYKNRIH